MLIEFPLFVRSGPHSKAGFYENESRLIKYITLHVRVRLRDLVVFSARLETESKMARRNVSDATSKNLKRQFLEWCGQKQSKTFSLLIIGKTGVGKSSLVNALVGKQVAGQRFQTADKVIPYDVEHLEGVKVDVWDSPGLIDDNDDDEGGAGKEKEYLAKIESEITEELDVVILCLKMDDKRFHRDDKDTFKILTETFGKKLWKNAVIALTFANKVEDPAGGNREDYFEHDLANWREAIHTFLSNTLKLDPELVQSRPIVPTGYHRPLSVLPNGGNWLSKFWIACYYAARNSAAFSLYRANKARLRFLGSELNVAAICGGSEVAPISPFADDYVMPAIDLDEEQQESFWSKTWEAFKEYSLSVGVVLGVLSTVGIAILKASAK